MWNFKKYSFEERNYYSVNKRFQRLNKILNFYVHFIKPVIMRCLISRTLSPPFSKKGPKKYKTREDKQQHPQCKLMMASTFVSKISTRAFVLTNYNYFYGTHQCLRQDVQQWPFNVVKDNDITVTPNLIHFHLKHRIQPSQHTLGVPT